MYLSLLINLLAGYLGGIYRFVGPLGQVKKTAGWPFQTASFCSHN